MAASDEHYSLVVRRRHAVVEREEDDDNLNAITQPKGIKQSVLSVVFGLLLKYPRNN